MRPGVKGAGKNMGITVELPELRDVIDQLNREIFDGELPALLRLEVEEEALLDGAAGWCVKAGEIGDDGDPDTIIIGIVPEHEDRDAFVRTALHECIHAIQYSLGLPLGHEETEGSGWTTLSQQIFDKAGIDVGDYHDKLGRWHNLNQKTKGIMDLEHLWATMPTWKALKAAVFVASGYDIQEFEDIWVPLNER